MKQLFAMFSAGFVITIFVVTTIFAVRADWQNNGLLHRWLAPKPVNVVLPKSSIVARQSPTPISVEFIGIGKLEPKPDITPEESAWLSILLGFGIASTFDRASNPDFAGFIKLHHLQRHFKADAPR